MAQCCASTGCTGRTTTERPRRDWLGARAWADLWTSLDFGAPVAHLRTECWRPGCSAGRPGPACTLAPAIEVLAENRCLRPSQMRALQHPAVLRVLVLCRMQ